MQAYLFSRVSTVNQSKGGEGINRQRDSAIKWITSTYPDWELSTTDFTFEGVSAYSSVDLLRPFFDACDQGLVIPGNSTLVLEAVDRLSRLPADDTRALWRKLQKEYNIDIAIVKWGIVFKHDENIGMGNDLMLTAAMHLSNMESAQKAERIRATIAIRRERARTAEGKKRSSVSPSWLRLSEDRSEFLIIPDRVDTVKKIFDLKLNKDMGATRICHHLDAEGIAPFGKAINWSRTSVRSILMSKAAIGEFQPQTTKKINGKKVYENAGEPISGYFPSIIDENIFYATQSSFKKVRQGKRGGFLNLLQGLIFCHSCGSLMGYHNKKVANGYKKIIRCNNAIKKNGCNESQLDYSPLEESMISVLGILDYSRLTGSGKGLSLLSSQIDDLKLQQQALDQKISNELDLVVSASSGIKARLLDRINILDADLSKVVEQLASLVTQQVSNTAKSSFTGILELESYDQRQSFNRYISSHIESLEPKRYKGKNLVRITFKASSEGAVIEYDPLTDTEQIVQMLYQNPDKDIEEIDYGIDFGGDEFDSRITITPIS